MQDSGICDSRRSQIDTQGFTRLQRHGKPWQVRNKLLASADVSVNSSNHPGDSDDRMTGEMFHGWDG